MRFRRLLLTLCLLGAWGLGSAAPASPPLRYGVLASFSPYQVWSEGGVAGGADVAIVAELARRIGVTIEPVRYVDFTRLEADLAAGRIQLASSMARTPEREAQFIFTRSYTSFQLALLTRADQPSGALLPDLAGRSIAQVRGYASQDQADRLFPLATRVVVNTVREGVEAVRTGRADTFLESYPVIAELIVRERITGLDIARRIDSPSGRLHLAVPRTEPALALRLTQALGTLEAGWVDAQVAAWSVRLPAAAAGPLVLNEAERALLASWPAPVVGVVGRDLPFIGPGGPRGAEGLSVDMLAATLAQLGVQPRQWRMLTPLAAAAAAAEGEVDVVVGLDESEDRTAAWRFVGPFLEYPMVLIGRPDGGVFDLEQLFGRRLALPRDSVARPFVNARHPSVQILDCELLEDCIDIVAHDDADATLADLASAGTTLTRRTRVDVQIVGTEPALRRYHSLAVNARHAALVPLFKRALDAAVVADLPAIKQRWLTRPTRSDVLASLLRQYAPWVLAGLLLASFIWWAHARSLRAEMQRTRSAQRDAEQAHAASRRFATFLAHELRNSLHAILAGTELARDPARSAEMPAALARTTRGALLLLNNLIDRERLDRGRLQLHPEPCHLGTTVRAVVDEMLPAAQWRGLSIDAPLPQPDPLLQTDAVRVQQIVRNLLSNAIKYGGANGPIELRMQIQPQAGDELCLVELTVADHGPGIHASDRERVFEPFQGSASEQPSSSGLGLALCRDLAHLLGGDLQLEERPGGGALLRLRFAAPLSRQPEPAAAAPAGPRRVLVAEDAPVYALLLEHALQQAGHQVLCVSSVADAIQALKQDRFDLLLADLNLADGPASQLLAAVKDAGMNPADQMVVMTADLDDPQASAPDLAAVRAVLVKSSDARQMVARVLRLAGWMG